MDTRIRNEETLSVLEVIQAREDKHMVTFPAENIADLHTAYQGPSPYHLNYCGMEKCAPGFQFGPSVRHSYLLHLVMKGKGTYLTGKKKYYPEAGQAFLIYPGDSTVYRADEKDPWSYCWIGFAGYQAEYILSQMGFSRQSHVVAFHDPQPLAGCIQEMLKTHQITLANELAREALLLQFFSTALQQLPAAAQGALHVKSTYAKLAMKYLTDHYMHKIRIQDIADYVGIDRSYLGKCFHAEYRMSPQEFLLNLRMRKAEELLETTRLAVNKVADQCGYPDALAFTRMFTKHFGCSPSQYRSNQKGSPQT